MASLLLRLYKKQVLVPISRERLVQEMESGFVCVCV